MRPAAQELRDGLGVGGDVLGDVADDEVGVATG
jgi:hypothetical protein